MDKETKKKIEVAETAAKKYIKNKRFSIQSLAEELDIQPSEIFELFPNRKSILLYFYESRLIVYQEQKESIDGYPEFTLSEKLSALFLHLLDQFLESREFVLHSYNRLISSRPSCTSFEETFKKELKTVFQSDEEISGSSRFFTGQILYATIYYHFHALILFWSRDESEKYEQSYALVDKWCSLIEEVFYSRIIDKGFDLGKFLFYNSPFKHALSNVKSSEDQS